MDYIGELHDIVVLHSNTMCYRADISPLLTPRAYSPVQLIERLIDWIDWLIDWMD
jgi:hypothetical protein